MSWLVVLAARHDAVAVRRTARNESRERRTPLRAAAARPRCSPGPAAAPSSSCRCGSACSAAATSERSSRTPPHASPSPAWSSRR
eukprot:724414-Prymnesium_polylepis.1